jgi:hypothetical protein
LRLATALLLLGALLASGCASLFHDPLGRQRALERSQRSYTQLMRWGDVERAAEYVDPELRERFMAVAPAFEAIRITDFEIGRIDYEEDAATVTVTYHAYGLSTFLEKRIRETQQWVRHEGNVWWVRPELDGLLDSFSEVRPH